MGENNMNETPEEESTVKGICARALYDYQAGKTCLCFVLAQRHFVQFTFSTWVVGDAEWQGGLE